MFAPGIIIHSFKLVPRPNGNRDAGGIGGAEGGAKVRAETALVIIREAVGNTADSNGLLVEELRKGAPGTVGWVELREGKEVWLCRENFLRGTHIEGSEGRAGSEGSNRCHRCACNLERIHVHLIGQVCGRIRGECDLSSVEWRWRGVNRTRAVMPSRGVASHQCTDDNILNRAQYSRV